MEQGHKFNDDLLTNPGDLKYAQEQYEEVWAALDDPELRKLFKAYDEPANQLKRRSRKWGKRAIVLGFFALFMAAAEPLIHELPEMVHYVLLAVAAISGIASFCIGMWGLLHSGSKSQWLRNRFMTERLRQLHFQTIVRGFSDIVASGGGADASSPFFKERARRFSKFVATHEQRVDAELQNVLEDDLGHHLWLVEPTAKRGPLFDNAATRKLVNAYRDLRILHQLGYAAYQLRDADEISPKAIRWQAKQFSNVSLFCIAGLLAVDLIMLVSILLGPVAGSERATTLASLPWLHMIALWIAALAIAMRALEEGLKPEREVERYQQYRAGLQAILQRYDGASTIAERIEVMNQLERLTYDEMRAFLLTHRKARFVM